MYIWYDLVLSALGPSALVPTALGHTRYTSLGHSAVSMQTSSCRVMFATNDDDDDTRSGWWMCNIQHIQLCWISRIHHPKRVMNIIFITLEGDEYHIHHPWGWWISYSSPLSVLKWWMWKYHHCQVPFGGIFITWKVPAKHILGFFFFSFFGVSRS